MAAPPGALPASQRQHWSFCSVPFLTQLSPVLSSSHSSVYYPPTHALISVLCTPEAAGPPQGLLGLAVKVAQAPAWNAARHTLCMPPAAPGETQAPELQALSHSSWPSDLQASAFCSPGSWQLLWDGQARLRDAGSSAP